MRFPWQRPEIIPPRQVAEEFIEVLLEIHPEIEITGYNEGVVEFETPDSKDCAIMLHKLHAALEFERHPKLKGRKKVYRGFIQDVFDPTFSHDEEKIGTQDQARILPRLVHAEFLSFAAERSLDIQFPHRPFYDTGLMLVYVLDSEKSVAYIADVHAADLELDEAGLYDKALENARTTYERDSLRDRYVDNDNFNMELCEDGHNSVCLILLPECLEPGEEIAVLMPDKDVFVAAPVPPDNNWNPLRAVAREGNPPYIEQPMLVSSTGVVMM